MGRRGVSGSQKETGANLRASSAERCRGGTPRAAWSLDGRRHSREPPPRPAGSAAGSESAPTAVGTTAQIAVLRRYRFAPPVGSLPPPASGSLRTPLPARRVPRPAPLPVVAGPYIRCPPALGSATAAMLSRSRCVSRAFSRSLSAFQKVRSGRAGPGG